MDTQDGLSTPLKTEESCTFVTSLADQGSGETNLEKVSTTSEPGRQETTGTGSPETRTTSSSAKSATTESTLSSGSSGRVRFLSCEFSCSGESKKVTEARRSFLEQVLSGAKAKVYCKRHSKSKNRASSDLISIEEEDRAKLEAVITELPDSGQKSIQETNRTELFDSGLKSNQQIDRTEPSDSGLKSNQQINRTEPSDSGLKSNEEPDRTELPGSYAKPVEDRDNRDSAGTPGSAHLQDMKPVSQSSSAKGSVAGADNLPYYIRYPQPGSGNHPYDVDMQSLSERLDSLIQKEKNPDSPSPPPNPDFVSRSNSQKNSGASSVKSEPGSTPQSKKSRPKVDSKDSASSSHFPFNRSPTPSSWAPPQQVFFQSQPGSASGSTITSPARSVRVKNENVHKENIPQNATPKDSTAASRSVRPPYNKPSPLAAEIPTKRDQTYVTKPSVPRPTPALPTSRDSSYAGSGNQSPASQRRSPASLSTYDGSASDSGSSNCSRCSPESMDSWACSGVFLQLKGKKTKPDSIGNGSPATPMRSNMSPRTKRPDKGSGSGPKVGFRAEPETGGGVTPKMFEKPLNYGLASPTQARKPGTFKTDSTQVTPRSIMSPKNWTSMSEEPLSGADSPFLYQRPPLRNQRVQTAPLGKEVPKSETGTGTRTQTETGGSKDSSSSDFGSITSEGSAVPNWTLSVLASAIGSRVRYLLNLGDVGGGLELVKAVVQKMFYLLFVSTFFGCVREQIIHYLEHRHHRRH
ncbi:hypothetical protein EGW08_018534 [Elysia chlorotica]|uniref:Uncharacterized protein n=1 Tax=Elysia chlorotica TaxID=188477 RepID=A0A3S1AVZ3_ELYCH|nr:hypothetical protein EGW08_018534 [Elysia chlorotica]